MIGKAIIRKQCNKNEAMESTINDTSKCDGNQAKLVEYEGRKIYETKQYKEVNDRRTVDRR